MKLTSHFTLEEMTFSEIAARLDLDNAADSIVTANLRLLAGVMEEIRAVLPLGGGQPGGGRGGYERSLSRLGVRLRLP